MADVHAALLAPLIDPWMATWRALGLAKLNQMWLMRHMGYTLPTHEADLLAAAEAPVAPGTPLSQLPDPPMAIVRAFLGLRAVAAAGVEPATSLPAAMSARYTRRSAGDGNETAGTPETCMVIFLDRCPDESGTPTEPQAKQVPIHLVQAAFEAARASAHTHLVLVAPGKLSFKAAELVRSTSNTWVWPVAKLALVPQRHDAVHTHAALPPDDVKGLMEGMCIQPVELPSMKTSDPVATFSLWPPDTVVHCRRFMPDGGYFRLVRPAAR